MSLFANNVPINKPFLESSPGVPKKTIQESGLFGKDGPSFKDVFDSVNPLQQLPGVGMLYRSETGDSISPIAKIAGGALFGGPIGAAISAVDAVVEMVSGASVGEHVMAAVTAAPAAPAVPQALAQAIADQALIDETAVKQDAATAADEAAKQEASLATLGRGNAVALDGAEIAAQESTSIPLASTQTASQFVYARQEQVYANDQAMQGLYKTTSGSMKI